MRRFVTLAVLIFFAIPFGISVSGCKHATAPTYCNGGDSGVQVGQLASLDLEPRLTGISLNYAEIGRVNSPTGKDCRGDSASVSTIVYASTNINIADVAPTTGSLCAGTWNRNTGGGIADYTVCTGTNISGVAYVTTTSQGVVSNAIPIFIHPTVTSIILGPASANCTTDPASNCVDLTQVSGCDTGTIVASSGILTISKTALSGGVATYTYATTSGQAPAAGELVTISGTTNGGGVLNVTNAAIATVSTSTTTTFTIAGFPTTTTLAAAADSGQAVTTIPAYNGQSCVSQGSEAELVARTYMNNGTTAADNISCLVGPITFTPLNSAILTIGSNGVTAGTGLATAAQPGSSAIGAATSQAASTVGFFNTCPPASIVLSVPPNLTAPTAPVSVNQNTAQPFTATVTDTKGSPITNITLQYISTSPTTIPTNGASVTPTYPGATAITAICQPPSCNPAPFNEIGLFGSGTPVSSNPVQISAAGTNFSTVLYMASKESQYLLPYDFTVTTQPAPVRLPYVPNSMVMSEDQTTLYMGTPYEIMTFSTASNSITKQDTTVSGTVLAVSDDNSTVIVTDPVRQLIYLYASGGGIVTQYGGVATSAEFTPDSSTVYITTSDGRLLVHSTFSGWTAITLATAPTAATAVAPTIPNAGVYIASNPVDVRTNCPTTSISGTGLAQTTTNVFYPDLGPVAGVNALSVAATNDGLHILSANTTSFVDTVTNQKTGACPITFTNSPGTPLSIANLGAISTSNTVTSSYTPNMVTPNVVTTSDSDFAFIAYQVAAVQTPTAGFVPQYNILTKTLTDLTLNTDVTGAPPTAPVSEVISADNNTVYVGTSNDNLVHILTRGSGSNGGFGDTKFITPALPNINGSGTATPDLLAQRPRKTTS